MSAVRMPRPASRQGCRDGHDAIAAVLRYRVLLPIHGEVAAQPPEGLVHTWTEVPMAPLVNDRWRAEFPVTELGTYVFTVESWVDPFETWGRQLAKRIEAGQDVATELEVGARMIEQAATRANGSAADAARLIAVSKTLRKGSSPALDGEIGQLMRRYADRGVATVYARGGEGAGEAAKARVRPWYELFPR